VARYVDLSLVKYARVVLQLLTWILGNLRCLLLLRMHKTRKGSRRLSEDYKLGLESDGFVLPEEELQKSLVDSGPLHVIVPLRPRLTISMIPEGLQNERGERAAWKCRWLTVAHLRLLQNVEKTFPDLVSKYSSYQSGSGIIRQNTSTSRLQDGLRSRILDVVIPKPMDRDVDKWDGCWKAIGCNDGKLLMYS
jgi:hypothetical protein